MKRRWKVYLNGEWYKNRKCPLRFKLGKTYKCKGSHRNRGGDCSYRNCPQSIEGMIGAGRDVGL